MVILYAISHAFFDAVIALDTDFQITFVSILSVSGTGGEMSCKPHSRGGSLLSLNWKMPIGCLIDF